MRQRHEHSTRFRKATNKGLERWRPRVILSVGHLLPMLKSAEPVDSQVPYHRKKIKTAFSGMPTSKRSLPPNWSVDSPNRRPSPTGDVAPTTPKQRPEGHTGNARDGHGTKPSSNGFS